jgi:hypothetical protein
VLIAAAFAEDVLALITGIRFLTGLLLARRALDELGWHLASAFRTLAASMQYILDDSRPVSCKQQICGFGIAPVVVAVTASERSASVYGSGAGYRSSRNRPRNVESLAPRPLDGQQPPFNCRKASQYVGDLRFDNINSASWNGDHAGFPLHRFLVGSVPSPKAK